MRARLAIGSPSQELKHWAKTWGTFRGRYRLIGSHVHMSGTCLVIFAADLERSGILVALKLMHNRAEWLREQDMRKLPSGHLLDAQHVVQLIDGTAEELEEDAGALDVRLKGDDSYRFLLVMQQAERDLSDALSHFRFAGRDRQEVIKILTQVAAHLKYLNEDCGRIHGDLKARNLIQMKIGMELIWLLIDMDASCAIGELAGQKVTSSASFPPEMARQELATRERSWNSTQSSPRHLSLQKKKSELANAIQEAARTSQFEGIATLSENLKLVEAQLKQRAPTTQTTTPYFPAHIGKHVNNISQRHTNTVHST